MTQESACESPVFTAASAIAGKVALTGASRGRLAAIGLTTAPLILIVVFVAVCLTR